MKNKENIVLVGMPAVGKSTVGVLLAKKLGYGFIDSDIIIQTREKMTLAQIIAAKGMEEFLEIEKKHLMGIRCARHVIATGGSAVYKADAMAHLAETSRIIYLSIDLDVLMTRLSDVVARGVAMGPGKGIADLYKERTPLYDQFCDIKIDCGTKRPDQVLTAIMQNLS